jgi:hypothetical protein
MGAIKLVSFTLIEEPRLRVFENSVLKKVSWPKQDKVTGGCRKLQEELHDSYSSSNIIGVIN